jgi:hypothetical protein
MGSPSTRRSFLAAGAGLLVASLATGCSNTSGPDPTIKVEQGPDVKESIKGSPRQTSKKPIEAAPEQRQSTRPG